MPRPSRKRGKQVKKRRISSNQVCIVTEMDRNGNIVIELICKGPMKPSNLKRLFHERIEKGSILFTNSHKSYIGFAKDFELEHYRVPKGKHKIGIYHIKHINSLHSRLKKFTDLFNGVST